MNFVFSLGVSKDFVLNKFKSKLTKLTEVKNNTKINNITQIINYEGTSPKDKKKWKNLVAEVLEKIKENQIEKVVLSRKVELKLSGEPNIDDLIDSLKKDYPTCYIFIFHKGKSSFFGATPEKLAKFTDGKIEIDAIAGSAPRGKNPDEDLMLENKLLADRKNLNEHNIVVEHIKNSISGITNNLNLDTHYGIKKLANIQHLWSKFSAELKNSSSIFSIIKELYPTPAICGFPKDTALHLIKRV
jgi:menaquinone-specific isochorismate synthase